jgi:hypothetical protein
LESGQGGFAGSSTTELRPGTARQVIDFFQRGTFNRQRNLLVAGFLVTVLSTWTSTA